jgi:hypothetical protein
MRNLEAEGQLPPPILPNIIVFGGGGRRVYEGQIQTLG